MSALREALQRNLPLAPQSMERPGWTQPLSVRQVPVPSTKHTFLAHARLRRTSPITHYAVASALEALGEDSVRVREGSLRLGIILCVLSGCVNYSRRFYEETLRDPATASPLVFPETVFNAPASHLAALLGTSAVNYTLVGDPGTFLQGVALAAEWLAAGLVDGCLVIGAEERDWLSADAVRHFSRQAIMAEGAGSVYLKSAPSPGAWASLEAITDSYLFFDGASRKRAVENVQAHLPPAGTRDVLCDGLQGVPRLDRAEIAAWKDWPGARLSPRRILGDGLAASAAWQVVAALDALRQGQYAGTHVSVLGCNQQAIGARFVALAELRP